MLVEFSGIIVKIPNGYTKTHDGTYINGHGVEYQLVQYGRGADCTICLETIYSKHVRAIRLEKG